ncbi:tRNA3(Ser)-specific nuclease WapA [Candidatus Brocadiaceae bacterium]|nr:tRNA3(Ser)-specific nuclease WapA [Candidatus Brocadiaceae bacterium]
MKVLNSESNGATTRYLHDISGLHSQQTPGGDWVFPIMDALGSVRGVVNPVGEVLEGQDYAPYGSPFGHTGTAQTPFGFTGEVTDASGLVYLRARYYLPELGVFPSLDPVEEGNRYGYVGGDVVNRVDPSGMFDGYSDCVISQPCTDWGLFRPFCESIERDPEYLTGDSLFSAAYIFGKVAEEGSLFISASNGFRWGIYGTAFRTSMYHYLLGRRSQLSYSDEWYNSHVNMIQHKNALYQWFSDNHNEVCADGLATGHQIEIGKKAGQDRLVEG